MLFVDDGEVDPPGSMVFPQVMIGITRIKGSFRDGDALFNDFSSADEFFVVHLLMQF